VGFGPASIAAGVSYYITGVQFEEGFIATPFENRPIGIELSLCQRYYETGSYLAGYYWVNTWGAARSDNVTFKQPKRIAPDMTGTVMSGAGWAGTWSTSSVTTDKFNVANSSTPNTGAFSTAVSYVANAEL
jgi:hypothetical protein